MMFRTTAFLTALTGATAASDIKANSRVGKSLLSKARPLNPNQGRKLDNDNSYTWITNYSIKFEKCATSEDYYGFGGDGNNNNNNNNNNNGYNGMYQQRLVHFKLCPSSTNCYESCENGADYVIDMNEFVNAYMESKMTAQEYNCEQVRENCYYDDETQCYASAGLDYCDDGNDNNNGDGEQFDIQEALECGKLDVDEDAAQYYMYQNGGNQQNGQNGQNGYYYGQNQNQNQEMELFVGPYCSADGASIYLGVFMDEMCSYEAPEGIFEKFNYGQALPYSSTSLIDNECISCKEPEEYDENNDGDQEDEDEINEVCEALYEESGKCEEGLSDNVVYYKNTYACEFISGLKVDGKTRSSFSLKPNVTPKVLAGVFAATTVALGGVAFYMHKKLQRNTVGLVHSGASMS